MLFFTSDEHFGHTNVLKYNNRPWDTIEEMDAGLICRFNEKVTPQDVTIHAGDFCWCNKKEDAYKKYIDKLNGTHILLVGSHDHWQPSSAKYIWRKRIDGQVVMVCHYAMRVWESSHYGAWMLYGHSHGNLPPIGKQHDIGVDNNNYYPVSFDEISIIMESKEDNFNLIRKD